VSLPLPLRRNGTYTGTLNFFSFQYADDDDDDDDGLSVTSVNFFFFFSKKSWEGHHD
jgi:hypothetical protein